MYLCKNAMSYLQIVIMAVVKMASHSQTHNKVVLFAGQKARGWDSLHATSFSLTTALCLIKE